MESANALAPLGVIEGWKEDQPKPEREADTFASEFLLPTNDVTLVREQALAFDGSHFLMSPVILDPA
jgi:hypothetical protein